MSPARTTTKENQIRHCHIHSDFCEKGHSDYVVYRATKDTVHVNCIFDRFIIRHIIYAYYYLSNSNHGGVYGLITRYGM